MESTLKLFLSIFVVFVFSAVVSAQDLRIIDTNEMKTFVAGKKKALIVDVRPRDEYAAGHIPKAINIPPDKFPKIGRYLPKGKDLPVIFYCRGYA